VGKFPDHKAGQESARSHAPGHSFSHGTGKMNEGLLWFYEVRKRQIRLGKRGGKDGGKELTGGVFFDRGER